jgi:Protein of unknown function (DUF2628)
MTVYSVHLPGEGTSGVAEAAFVREGFTRAAFWLGPLWLLKRRLWLGLAVWLAAFFILLILLAAGVLSGGATLLVIFLMQVLLGLEANRLLEAKLWKDGYNLVEIVAAPALDQAETAFYRHFESRDSIVMDAPPQTGPAPAAGRAIVGSFPEPGARR